MSVTIKEIAQLSGVSRGTVDRVLNKRGNVNPETAKRIEELAISLGYTPNKAATALAAKKKNIVIGVLVISEGNIFFDDILSGIQNAVEELHTYGVTVIIEKMKGYNIDIQLSLIDKLMSQNIHGLVLTPINDPLIAKKLSTLSSTNIPVVTLNSDIENTHTLCYVGIDYFKSGQIAAGLLGLLKPTSCHVGVVTGSFKSLGHTKRIQGFESTLSSKYPHINLIATVENNDDDIESFEVTKQLLLNYPDLDTIYLTAAGVYGAARAVQSHKSQKNITMICCDDIPQTKELVRQGVISATICQQPITQGYRSMKILFEYIVHNVLPSQDVLTINNEIKISENI